MSDNTVAAIFIICFAVIFTIPSICENWNKQAVDTEQSEQIFNSFQFEAYLADCQTVEIQVKYDPVTKDLSPKEKLEIRQSIENALVDTLKIPAK